MGERIKVDGAEELLPRENLSEVKNEAGRSVVHGPLEVLEGNPGKNGGNVGENETIMSMENRSTKGGSCTSAPNEWMKCQGYLK